MKNFYLTALAGLLLVTASHCKSPTEYTKGVGLYPGNPSQDYAPALIIDAKTHRNVAKGRMVYHSSAYDYNLTGQLVADGIFADRSPSYINVSTHLGDLKKREREWLFDGKTDSRYTVPGNEVYIQLDFYGRVPDFTEMHLKGIASHLPSGTGAYIIAFYGSQDGLEWKLLKKEQDLRIPGKVLSRNRKEFVFTCPVKDPGRYAFYKIVCKAPGVTEWAFAEWEFLMNNKPVDVLPSADFVSAWMSEGTDSEWLMVDFGAQVAVDSVVLHWLNKAIEGSVEFSNDKKEWTTAAVLSGEVNPIEIVRFKQPVQGRYVKLCMDKPLNNKQYILSELQVFGTGGLVPVPKDRALPKGNTLFLNGGDWRVQRSSLVPETGFVISRKGYKGSSDWPVATVPGTVLTSYVNTGAIPNPHYADNQLHISESFFQSDFWYRTVFFLPEDFNKQELFLHFEGINWKAVVFLNGRRVGFVEGAFDRAKLNITKETIPGTTNILAVRIIKNRNFGAVKEQNLQSPDQNGGILGADNPTFHASIGWDWIPTIRGRNMGIWDNVYISTSGSVSMEDTYVQTLLPLPDTTNATICLQATLKNHKNVYVSGFWKGSYGPVAFSKEITLAPEEIRTVYDTVHLQNPQLWWPNGYGKAHLYPVQMQFVMGRSISDSLSFQSGVRRMDYTVKDSVLYMYINGKRFIGRGGNWGFPEAGLNYRDREYDIAVAYHAHMNFTMIRNWVGQTGHDAFYRACDRHGIMVWQDFWLANPWDGPVPGNNRMFMENARSLVKRIRNHPCIAIYAGRNEGYPPPFLDSALQQTTADLHPDIKYISHSSADGVSGHGPYRTLPAAEYFGLSGQHTMHTERGMPNVMNYESLQRTLPEEHLWPINDLWGMHDFCLEGAQSAATFIEMTERAFGPAPDARTFTKQAQWINYDGYRALFESRSAHRQGLLLWMSHPAWPSMVWQTYDYYFDPTAAYFACKKASEPLHIQWNSLDNKIEIVNLHAGNRERLTATVQVLDTEGTVHWRKDTLLHCPEDTTLTCCLIPFPETLSDVHFIQLSLTENKKTVSENFYWRGKEAGNLKALLNLPKVRPEVYTTAKRKQGVWTLKVRLHNNTSTPCLMLHLKVTGKKSKEQILPVFYSDNFFSLMPGEKKKVTITLKDEDTQGEKPRVLIDGFNLSTRKKH
ncbi:MAG: discoidin domain-containing protein [Bacteroidales bacterium]|jgi:hypothetical protein